jgi:hypothetical protein
MLARVRTRTLCRKRAMIDDCSTSSPPADSVRRAATCLPSPSSPSLRSLRSADLQTAAALAWVTYQLGRHAEGSSWVDHLVASSPLHAALSGLDWQEPAGVRTPPTQQEGTAGAAAVEQVEEEAEGEDDLYNLSDDPEADRSAAHVAGAGGSVEAWREFLQTWCAGARAGACDTLVPYQMKGLAPGVGACLSWRWCCARAAATVKCAVWLRDGEMRNGRSDGRHRLATRDLIPSPASSSSSSWGT